MSMGPNIIRAGFPFPPLVCILAPGPAGAPFWKNIPDGAHVLAVNGAIEIPLVAPGLSLDSWLVADGHAATRTAWFRRNVLAPRKARLPIRMFSTAVIRASGALADYHFSLVPYFEPGFRRVPNLLRPDETVAGCAIDLACRCGAREILLVGVDMRGETYFDGSPVSSVDSELGDRWGFADALDGLITWHLNEGFLVRSLSPTALRIGPKGERNDAS